jgi:hypothetical protein
VASISQNEAFQLAGRQGDMDATCQLAAVRGRRWQPELLDRRRHGVNNRIVPAEIALVGLAVGEFP